jgi:hypothetical protein
MKIPVWLDTIKNWTVSKIDLTQGWIPFVNSNLKWAFSFTIRVFTITFCIIGLIIVIKYFKVVKDLRYLVMNDGLNIKEIETTVTSYPKINYDQDIKNVDQLIQFLEKKKKGSTK